MTMKIEGMGVTNSSMISCRIRMSVLMTRAFKADASTALTIVTFVTATMTHTNAPPRAITTNGLATGHITAPIAIIERKHTFVGASDEAPIFLV